MRTRLITSAIICLLTISTVFAGGDGNKTKNKGKSENNSATVSLAGKITDRETGEGLAGVLIKLDDTGIAVYSDFDGNFNIAVTPGAYTIKTALISYESATLNINTDDSRNLIDIKLGTVTKK